MSRVQKEIGQQMIARYRQNRTSQNGEFEMPKLKLKDQRPEYVLDREAMAERMREAVEQCEDYGTTEIAEFCGCDRSLVYEWCRVGGSRPGMDNLTAFCKATGADWEWLMFGVSEETSKVGTHTDDDNVVQLERIIEAYDTHPRTSSVLRYVGIYELDEIRDAISDDPKLWINHISSFAKQPSERTCLAITLNADKLHLPGIPSFILQYLIDGPHFERGTFLGYATDIAPARGKFCTFAIKKRMTGHEQNIYTETGEDPRTFTIANGYYYPLHDRLLASTSMGDTYKQANKGFVLQLDRDNPSPDDVVCVPDDFDDWLWDCRILGVVTWMCHWQDDVALKNHTGMWERLDKVYEGRRIRQNEPMNPDGTLNKR